VPTPVLLILFLTGLALTLGASEILVRGVTRLGVNVQLGAGILGLLIALGADSPEISAAVSALASNAREVGLGVILGSNIFNLAALLGGGALAAGRVRARRGPLLLAGGTSLAMTLVVAGFAATVLSAAATVALLVGLFFLYVAAESLRPRIVERWPLPLGVRGRLEHLLRVVHAPVALPGKQARALPQHQSWVPVTLVPIAVFAIVGGSWLMVSEALTLARRYGVSDVVLGTVVLAAITGLPNLYAAVHLALAGRGTATVSETFNSNTINLVVVVGASAAVLGGSVAASIAGVDLVWLLGMTAAAMALCARPAGLTRPAGVLLIVAYCLFVVLRVA
jgi:cation:H+ antiporter